MNNSVEVSTRQQLLCDDTSHKRHAHANQSHAVRKSQLDTIMTLHKYCSAQLSTCTARHRLSGRYPVEKLRYNTTAQSNRKSVIDSTNRIYWEIVRDSSPINAEISALTKKRSSTLRKERSGSNTTSRLFQCKLRTTRRQSLASRRR